MSKVIQPGTVKPVDNQFAPGKAAKGGGDNYVSPSKSNDIKTTGGTALGMPKDSSSYMSPSVCKPKASSSKAK